MPAEIQVTSKTKHINNERLIMGNNGPSLNTKESYGTKSREVKANTLSGYPKTQGDGHDNTPWCTISADGRVIAANSPTLYAIAGGTVALKVVAGDVVKKGQALAEIDSPELRSKLAQEGSTLASMEAEASRALLDAQITRSTASKLLDQARIERTAAERDLERYERAYQGGAVSQNEYAKAQDELKKADIGLAAARKDSGLQGEGAGLDSRNKRLLADRQRAVVTELQRQVDALTVRAPFDGQIGQVQIPQGTNVATNAPILSVVDHTNQSQ